MKKLIIVITSCLFMFAFVFIVLMLINNMQQQTKINKGIKEFGTDYCQGHSRLDPVGYAFTDWECEICGYTGRESNTGVPEICGECAVITERCRKCGKVKSYTDD